MPDSRSKCRGYGRSLFSGSIHRCHNFIRVQFVWSPELITRGGDYVAVRNVEQRNEVLELHFQLAKRTSACVAFALGQQITDLPETTGHKRSHRQDHHQVQHVCIMVSMVCNRYRHCQRDDLHRCNHRQAPKRNKLPIPFMPNSLPFFFDVDTYPNEQVSASKDLSNPLLYSLAEKGGPFFVASWNKALPLLYWDSAWMMRFPCPPVHLRLVAMPRFTAISWHNMLRIIRFYGRAMTWATSPVRTRLQSARKVASKVHCTHFPLPLCPSILRGR